MEEKHFPSYTLNSLDVCHLQTYLKKLFYRTFDGEQIDSNWV